MPSFDEIKATLDSEIQALESRTQAAKELQAHFNEDGWDESVAVINNYAVSLEEWHDRLSRVHAQVVQREAEEQQVAAVSPFEKYATDLEDAVRRIAANQEEVAKHMAATQEEIARRLGGAHEEIARNLATVQEETTRLISAQESLGKQTTQSFLELAAHIQNTASSFKSDTHPGPIPEQTPVQFDTPQPEEPPENPGFWSKS
ncbi:hypothetical protein Aple_029990 [Acrocarpospora pleiomorpha]|uniref:Uncharacterized protein n=1 Tax=Acrocarpospora pleiomorpha TaxID=90975 RepID=A0A5M3XLR6_9ACTN|nr:hypothetical protein [Acrocarpospora pleiomorpha]GES20103.1 hypothetical protein Aple_029990 [Acrocarpospora pleiomorpha]